MCVPISRPRGFGPESVAGGNLRIGGPAVYVCVADTESAIYLPSPPSLGCMLTIESRRPRPQTRIESEPTAS